MGRIQYYIVSDRLSQNRVRGNTAHTFLPFLSLELERGIRGPEGRRFTCNIARFFFFFFFALIEKNHLMGMLKKKWNVFSQKQLPFSCVFFWGWGGGGGRPAGGGLFCLFIFWKIKKKDERDAKDEGLKVWQCQNKKKQSILGF